MAGIPRSRNDNLEVALARVAAAPSPEGVVSIVRDYVAAEPASLDWLPSDPRDPDELAGCAVDLARHRMRAEHPVLEALEVLFGRACVRIATLTDRAGAHRNDNARRFNRRWTVASPPRGAR